MFGRPLALPEKERRSAVEEKFTGFALEEGLTLEELEAEKGELLPDREEMSSVVFQNQQQFQAFNINANQAAVQIGANQAAVQFGATLRGY
jgi:hypothetical protein